MPTLLDENPALVDEGRRIETEVVCTFRKAGKHVGLSDRFRRGAQRRRAVGELDQKVAEQGSLKLQGFALAAQSVFLKRFKRRCYVPLCVFQGLAAYLLFRNVALGGFGGFDVIAVYAVIADF